MTETLSATEQERAWELSTKDAKWVFERLAIGLAEGTLTFDRLNDYGDALKTAARRVEGMERP